MVFAADAGVRFVAFGTAANASEFFARKRGSEYAAEHTLAGLVYDLGRAIHLRFL